MADAEHPYPAAEHYTFPTNAAEAMADNRRLYTGDHDAMLLYAGRYIPTFYGRAPLFEYFMQASRLVYVNQVKEGEIETPEEHLMPRAIDNEFHVGTLIGMDTWLSTMRPSSLKRGIMSRNPLAEFKRSDLTEEDKARFTKEVEALTLFRSASWKSVAKESDPAYRTELVETARLLFKDDPDRDRKRQEVIAGIVFAHITIKKIGLQIRAESE